MVMAPPTTSALHCAVSARMHGLRGRVARPLQLAALRAAAERPACSRSGVRQ